MQKLHTRRFQMGKKKNFNDAWFDALTEKRRKKAEEKHDPEYASMWEENIDIYPDSAHFVYELLQNADDTGATEAHFILEPDRLIFKHNGTRHFTISNPDSNSIEEDRKNGKYGDINSITARGFSSKKTEHDSNKIGKFGVGFMAVFQYTDSPEIYDDNICFKIEDHIIPIRLKNDFPKRKKNETVFVFPFNNPDTQNNAYEDISNKLENLENPTLFLTNLKKITYNTNELNGKYALKSLEIREIEPNTHAERIRIHYDDTDDTDNIWIFSRRTDNNLAYSVGFWIDGNLNFIPWAKDHAYCYFTTKEDTHLNFIIHAPFALTKNRANIKAGNDHNKNMIQLLAELAGDALLYFRDMSTEDHRYITDQIFDLIPLNEKMFGDIDNSENISFKPFYTEIRKRFETDCLMPGKTRCVSKDHAYWASTAQIMELFSTEQLKEITGNSDAEWVLSQFGRNSSQGIKIRNYVDELIHDYFDEDVQSKNILNKIDSDFIEHQDTAWLLKFYQWCSETERRKKEALKRPIILNQNNKAVSVQAVFLPDDNIKDLQTVSPTLIANDEIRSLFESKFNIRKPELWDYITNKIIPRYYTYYQTTSPLILSDNEITSIQNDFILIFKYYINNSTLLTKLKFQKLKDVAFIPYKV